MTNFLPALGRHGRWVAAAATLLIVPSFAQAGVIVRAGGGIQNNFQYGPIKFHPKSITIAVDSQVGGNASFRVKQKGNTKNHYKATIACQLTLGNPPRVNMNGNKGQITVPPQGLLGVSVGCNVTVLGEGGVTGTLPVLLDINL